jgi:hypothetical protein
VSARERADEGAWEVAVALGCEAEVRALERWLQETARIEGLFEDDERAWQQVAAAAAEVRTRRDDLAEHARRLRAAAKDTSRGGRS